MRKPKKRDGLVLYKKTIKFIKSQDETCFYWPGWEDISTLSVQVKYKSMCDMVDFKFVFIVPYVYPFFRSLQSHNALFTGGNSLTIPQWE